MKKILVLLLLLAASTSVFSAQISLYEPRNLDFESSRKGMPPTFWTLPEAYAEVGYQFIATDHTPGQGDFSGRIYLHKQLDTTIKRGLFYQSISAYRYIGKTIRITYTSRASFLNDSSRAVVFFQIKNNDGTFDFKELTNQPIKSYDWEERVMEIKIPNNASELSYGISLFGLGDAYLDDIKFEIIQPNEQAKVINGNVRLSNDDMMNLVDFANVHGMVRYYSPFFNGLEANWDDILVSGVEAITNGINPSAIADFIENHYKPLCPTLEIINNGNIPPRSVKPQNNNDSLAYSWLHMGAYSANEMEFFASQYRNIAQSTRIREGTLMQEVKLPKRYYGKTIEVSMKAKQKAYDISGATQLWVRIDRDSGYVQSKRKSEIIRGTADWTEHKIQVKVREKDVDAVRIGLMAIGEVDAYYDDIHVKIVETNEEIPVKDFSAEGAIFHPKAGFGWYYPTSVLEAGYIPEITTDESFKGTTSLSLKANEDQRIRFSQPGEYATYKSPRGYEVQIPLALWGKTVNDKPQTIPPSNEKMDFSIYATERRPAGYYLTAEDAVSRIAILTDLYIYFKNFGIDLNAEALDNLENMYMTYLQRVNLEINQDEFDELLNEFVAEFKRPNIFVYEGWDNSKYYTFPFRTKFTDNRELMVNITYDSTLVVEGTEIIKINGKKVSELFNNPNEPYYNFLNTKKFSTYRIGDKDTEIEFEFKYPNGQTETKIVKRSHELGQIQETRPRIVHPLADSILYIDVTVWTDKELMDNRKMLKNYKHIIFDCRGRIHINPLAIGMFVDKQLKGIDWAFAEYTAPGNKWNSYNDFPAIIKGHNHVPNRKLYFIVDERSVGFSNDLIKLVQFHKIGTVYGRKAPASQYESLYYSLPGSYTLSFTPGKATLPDGSDALAKPIIPDVEIPFDKQTASSAVPFLTKILSDIQESK